MKLGVFDSGVGGQAVADELALAFPELEIVLRQDPEHLPYGNKRPDELFTFVLPILKSMERDGCQTVVLACNTVSTTILPKLRDALPGLRLFGVEPMLRQAVEMTTSGVVAVCATPVTLASQRYKDLVDQYATSTRIYQPDCSDWASMVEYGKIEADLLAQRLQPAVQAGADVFVLGCTHYHWIEDTIRQIIGPKPRILQPVPQLIRQLTPIIGQPRLV